MSDASNKGLELTSTAVSSVGTWSSQLNPGVVRTIEE
jgi:hypothetical protein